MAASGQAPPAARRSRPGVWALITVLLLASIVATLWVPFYARTKPELGGFPFFYWYQLMWVPIVGVLSWLAYLLTKAGRRAPGGPAEAGPGPDRGEAA